MTWSVKLHRMVPNSQMITMIIVLVWWEQINKISPSLEIVQVRVCDVIIEIVQVNTEVYQTFFCKKDP